MYINYAFNTALLCETLICNTYIYTVTSPSIFFQADVIHKLPKATKWRLPTNAFLVDIYVSTLCGDLAIHQYLQGQLILGAAADIFWIVNLICSYNNKPFL